MSTSITLRDVQKRYGDHLALDIPQLEIRSGCVTGLLGENGAGKTTLIDLIAGVSAPSCGRIDTGDARVGWCSQRLVIDWFVTGWMNVWLGACLQGLSGAAAKAATDEAIARVGLGDAKLDSTPEVLSGGQQQRLMIARTFAMNPDIYLLDEPTVGLDLHNLERFSKHVRLVGQRGATVLISSHEFEAVEPLIDDVVFLADGRVKFFGSRRDFTDRFVTRETMRIVVDRPICADDVRPIEGLVVDAEGPVVTVDAPRDTDFATVFSCLPDGIDVLEYARQPVSLRQAVKWASHTASTNGET